jgi:hypothetical protein
VGPRAVLDAVMKRKIPSPRWKSNPRTPIVQPVTQRYTDRAFMALTITAQKTTKTTQMKIKEGSYYVHPPPFSLFTFTFTFQSYHLPIIYFLSSHSLFLSPFLSLFLKSVFTL